MNGYILVPLVDGQLDQQRVQQVQQVRTLGFDSISAPPMPPMPPMPMVYHRRGESHARSPGPAGATAGHWRNHHVDHGHNRSSRRSGSRSRSPGTPRPRTPVTPRRIPCAWRMVMSRTHGQVYWHDWRSGESSWDPVCRCPDCAPYHSSENNEDAVVPPQTPRLPMPMQQGLQGPVPLAFINVPVPPMPRLPLGAWDLLLQTF